MYRPINYQDFISKSAAALERVAETLEPANPSRAQQLRSIRDRLMVSPDGIFEIGSNHYAPADTEDGLLAMNIYIMVQSGLFADIVKSAEAKIKELTKRFVAEAENLAIDNKQKMYTINEASDLVSVNRSTLWKWKKAGKIKAVRIGSTWRIGEAEIKRICAGDIKVGDRGFAKAWKDPETAKAIQEKIRKTKAAKAKDPEASMS